MADAGSAPSARSRWTAGPAANDFLMQFQSDILRRHRCAVLRMTETTALGAAFLVRPRHRDSGRTRTRLCDLRATDDGVRAPHGRRRACRCSRLGLRRAAPCRRRRGGARSRRILQKEKGPHEHQHRKRPRRLRAEAGARRLPGGTRATSVTDRGPDRRRARGLPRLRRAGGAATWPPASAERGVLVCGTGIGMAVAANKVDGIRAANVVQPGLRRASRREHNDANVVALSGRFVSLRGEPRASWTRSSPPTSAAAATRAASRKIAALRERAR